jgi:iron complex outermembrane receptor protein
MARVAAPKAGEPDRQSNIDAKQKLSTREVDFISKGRNMPRKARLLRFVSFVSLLGATPALAQTQTQPSGAAPAPVIGEVVVTARRHEESLQRVPVSVSVVNQVQLQTQDVQDAVGLQHAIPSLVTSPSVVGHNNESFSLRGIGTTAGASPGVAIYISEVPYVFATSLGSAAPSGVYFDLQNVQVLKGPQGTLFGKNTTGGAVLFEPQHPMNDYEGYLQVGAGDYNRTDVEGAINLPIISDKVLLRLAVQEEQRDGYTIDAITHKDYDNLNFYSGRLSLTVRPTEQMEIYTMVDYHYSHDNGIGLTLDEVQPGSFLTYLYPGLAAYAAEERARGPRLTELSDSALSQAKQETYGVVNNIQYHVTPDLTLKNIFGYRVYKDNNRNDGDGSPFVIFDEYDPGDWANDLFAVTDELQVQGSAFSRMLDFTAGAYFEYSGPEVRDGGTYPPGTFSTCQFGGGAFPVVDCPLYELESRATQSQSVYAQGNLALDWLLRGLKATAGVRYTVDRISATDDSFEANGLCIYRYGSETAPGGACFWSQRAVFQAPTYQFGLNYQVTPDLLLYLVNSRGYKAGGFNVDAPYPDNGFKPEYDTNYEGGVKAQFHVLGMPAQVNADGYFMRYSNIQVSVPIIAPDGGLSETTGNGALAHITGFEFDGALVPSPWLELHLSYAYTDALFIEAPALYVAGFDRLPNAPKHKVSFTPTLHLPVPDQIGRVSLSAAYSYQSSISTANGVQYSVLPGYDLLDMRLDWRRVFNHPFDVSLYVTNLTNKTYMIGGYDTFGSVTGGVFAPAWAAPRMFGAQLRYHFN